MTLNFQELHEQIRKLGEQAPMRYQQLQELRERASELLAGNSKQFELLSQRVRLVAQDYDPNLRCALPALGPDGAFEPLDSHVPLPPLPSGATILAADGSQISPDRHVPVNFCLINIGAIQLQIGSQDAPKVSITSQLMVDEQLYTPGGTITDARLALMRDLKERRQLAAMAEQVVSAGVSHASSPLISFTDGPMELWGAREADSGSEFQKSLSEYLEVLSRLERLGVATAGYVDKPAANLVVRLLEVASLPEGLLPEIRSHFPLRGVVDRDLFWELLEPGERSAVFAFQSRSAQEYSDDLALHFFYLNVGRPGHPWLARVDVPAWVVRRTGMLDNLHAAIVHQCRILGSRPYPYLLHRAHEAALVTLQEKEQVINLIASELYRQGLPVGQFSNKQGLKVLPKKTAYER